MKEEIKITITLTDDNIVLYGENTQDFKYFTGRRLRK